MYLGDLLRKKLAELPPVDEAALDAYLDEVEEEFCFVCGNECCNHPQD